MARTLAGGVWARRRSQVAVVVLVMILMSVTMVNCRRQTRGHGDLLPRDHSIYRDSTPFVSSEQRRANRNRPSRRTRKRQKSRHLLTNEEPGEMALKEQQGQLLLQQQQLQHLQEADVPATDHVPSNFPPSFLRPAPNGNPLKDQPNLSKGRTPAENAVIYGSRKAFTITKLEYLKKEWCKTEPLKQVIREEGCRRRTIVNRFCYGQCNSFFIPKSNKNDKDSAAFRSCAFCKPKRTSTITVTLICPNRRPGFKRKRIEMVKQCNCMAQRLN